jgi:hypothetical protein
MRINFDFVYRAAATTTFLPRMDLNDWGRVVRFVQIDKESLDPEIEGFRLKNAS